MLNFARVKGLKCWSHLLEEGDLLLMLCAQSVVYMNDTERCWAVRVLLFSLVCYFASVFYATVLW